MENEVLISINTTFGIGGLGRHEHAVEFETAQLMMNADIIQADNQSYKVKNKVVNLNGSIDFYVEQIEDNEQLF
ncbi:hypothetical protein [Virgibacillus halodenitrificans]|uniref:hypothetical protein n=1 Tax=Virgibacillus halodenitrificans TaxID=1482 RepID=UPI000EF441AC|nr:hypothetical protein [Virgibacillus halodenitrificans]